MKFITAIDGPAGTGKSSVARFLARDFNFVYVDTGAIYRALAFLVLKYDVDIEDVDVVVALIPKISVIIDEDASCTRIIIDGKLIDAELRSEEISKFSSMVSQHKRIREALLPVQRDLVDKIKNGAIFEGRDIGTVVFPHAPLKIFITANSETRARRRYEEIKDYQTDSSFEDVLKAIKKRDERDQNRATSPMQQAKDAYVIDTSSMTLEQVTKEASELIKRSYKSYQQGSKLW